jgi:hypothetical protein
LKLPQKITNLNFIRKEFNVPDYFYFKFSFFLKNKEKILTDIKKKFKNKIIIRSASYDEDNKISNAGKYLSIPNISSKDLDEVRNSIIKVFKSFGNKKNKNYIFIQEYIENASVVGVIFTSDPNNGAPFRTINFNNSNSTDLITSGKSNGEICYYFRDIKKKDLKQNTKNIETTIRKIENKFSKIALDIEFLILKKKIYILQVRQLNATIKYKINFKKSLRDLEKKILKMKHETTHLIGKKRYYSNMTDWNPAEIVGLKPKTLAISLYESLVTDEIWAESRKDLGYNDTTKIPLLYSFLGTPYIDLRTDINSFLIPNLSKKIQEKLINFYFNQFKKNPYKLYDKIESSLVINCISLDINKYKKLLSESTLSKKEKDEVINKYINLTSKIIFKLNDNIKKYESGEYLLNQQLKSKNSPINKIYLLHNICKNYGTLPFANLARMAFIGVEFVNSFEKLNIISSDEKKNLLETNKSISQEMYEVLKKSKSKFLNNYGHLRPNTYEISNPNYKENFKNYFEKAKRKETRLKKFSFSENQKKKINYYLKKNKFKKIDANILINFIESSIYQREKSKLFFTKIINSIFTELKILSKRIGLKDANLSYLNIKNVLSLYNNFSHYDIIKNLNKDIQENKKTYRYNKNFNLPSIIISKKDIYYFEEKKASPTFITNKKIISKFTILGKMSKKSDLNDKIICIENADPGYDFIFNYKINGLITAFGGPNSHMSIRCNEFSIPAAIGVGELKFKQLNKNNTLYLNCEKKMLSGI